MSGHTYTHTYIHTHRTTTGTLAAHACRGLIIIINRAGASHVNGAINRAGASHVNGACEHAHIHERQAVIVLCMLHVPYSLSWALPVPKLSKVPTYHANKLINRGQYG